MAPHNSSYFDLLSHLRAADIMFIPPGPPQPNQPLPSQAIVKLIQENIHNFAKPILQMGLSTSCFSLL